MTTAVEVEVKPKRIQRKRVKGWTMPPNTIYVGRPTMWGNPYGGDDLSLRLYRNTVLGAWEPSLLEHVSDEKRRELYDRHVEWRKRSNHALRGDIQRLLRGRDLACWCKEGSPCHADILLELANQ